MITTQLSVLNNDWRSSGQWRVRCMSVDDSFVLGTQKMVVRSSYNTSNNLAKTNVEQVSTNEIHPTKIDMTG